MHYHAKTLEAGYHKLDKSKVKEKDISVKNMDDLENIVKQHKGWVDLSIVSCIHYFCLEQQWSDLSRFPFDEGSTFPKVVPALQVISVKSALKDLEGRDYTHDRASKPGTKHLQASVDSILKEGVWVTILLCGNI